MAGLAVSATTFSYMWTHSAKDAFSHLADVGYKTFELLLFPPHCWPADMTSAERGEIKTVLEDRGLRVTSFCYPLMDNNPNSPCKHMRAYTKDRYREIIDFAGELGCRNVCIIPGVVTKLIDPPFEWARDWFVETLDELGQHAAGVGVDLAVENVPFALLPTVDQCLDAIERCGRDNVGMNYDVCNAVCIKEDPADGIRKIGKDRLRNVHISDTPRDRMLHARLGTGVVDPAPIAKALNEIGYQGHTVIEIITDLQIAGNDPDQDLIVSNQILAESGWEPLAA